MKLQYKELLRVLRTEKMSREETLQLLIDNKRKAGLRGIVFNSKHITKYKVMAIRYVEQQLGNRCSFDEWNKSHDEKFGKVA